MKSVINSLLFFILCFNVSVALAESTPAFWTVTKGSSTVYLLGSMHFGRPDFYPLPNEINEAYTHSHRLAVEVDMTQVSPKDAMGAILKYSALPSGQTLKTVLSENVYQQLEAQCRSINIPVSAFERFQPWFVAIQLLEAELKKTNLQQALGTDIHFLSLGGKKVDELETLDFQLGMFSGFSLLDQEQFLVQTLKDIDGSSKILSVMAEAWKSGNLADLEKELIISLRDNPETKELFDAIFTRRNVNMANAIIDYLKRTENVFFIVGAGHMIGQEGIVNLLEKKGYNIKRVSFSGKEQVINTSVN